MKRTNLLGTLLLVLLTWPAPPAVPPLELHPLIVHELGCAARDGKHARTSWCRFAEASMLFAGPGSTREREEHVRKSIESARRAGARP